MITEFTKKKLEYARSLWTKDPEIPCNNMQVMVKKEFGSGTGNDLLLATMHDVRGTEPTNIQKASKQSAQRRLEKKKKKQKKLPMHSTQARRKAMETRRANKIADAVSKLQGSHGKSSLVPVPMGNNVVPPMRNLVNMLVQALQSEGIERITIRSDGRAQITVTKELDVAV